MLHTCDQRFDVTDNLEKFYELNEDKAKPPPAPLSTSTAATFSRYATFPRDLNTGSRMR